jgi:hypothetical protein
MVKSGTTVSIQTDGPRGPARKSKLGIVALARSTGAPIVPVGFAATPCLRFRSWDRMLLPLPFARVRCVFAPRIQIPRDADSGAEAAALRDLDGELDRLTAAMDARMRLRDVRIALRFALSQSRRASFSGRVAWSNIANRRCAGFEARAARRFIEAFRAWTDPRP